MSNYDLDYTGQAVDRILDTGYDLQNNGYMFRGVSNDYFGTPTEKVWLIAGEGSTGHGFINPVPKGCIGICMFNGSSWSTKTVEVVVMESPTNGSTNAAQSGAVYTLATEINAKLGSLTLEDTTAQVDEASKMAVSLKMTTSGTQSILTSLTILAATVEKAGLLSAADKAKINAILSMVVEDTTEQADEGDEITESLKWTVGGVESVISAFTILAATTEKAGLLSADDKKKIDSFIDILDSMDFEDTTASADQGTKIEESVNITVDHIDQVIAKLTLLAATSSKAGLMSAADKAKLTALASEGYLYAGVATPSGTPAAATGKVFYLANESGTYTEYGEITLPSGISILMLNGSTWSSVLVYGVDEKPTADSRKLVESGGVYKRNTEITSCVNSILKKYYIDYNHVCNYDPITGNFIYRIVDTYDSLWLVLFEETTSISISGVTITRYNFFSDVSATQDAFILNNTTGIIPSGAKLVIISLSHELNPDGYENLVITQNNPFVQKSDVDDIVNEHAEIETGLIREASGHPYIILNHLGNYDIDRQFLGIIDSDAYDCIIQKIPNGSSLMFIEGAVNSIIGYFNDVKIDVSTFISASRNGTIPSGAKYALINLKHSENPDGYGNLKITFDNEIDNNTTLDYLRKYPVIRNIPESKNLIDKDDCIYDYGLINGLLEKRTDWIMSNKIYVRKGITYAVQGVVYWSNANRIFFAMYDTNDNYIGRFGVDAVYEEGDSYGSCVFMFNREEDVAYLRVVLQTATTAAFDPAIAQMEEGFESTQFVEYIGASNKTGERKTLRLLLIGNSYSQDAAAYMPFIMKNMKVDMDVQIGILMQSSSTLQNHVNNFNNETAAYTFYLYNGGNSWQNLGSKTIQWALYSYIWDIVSLQQASSSSFDWTTYQPYLNQIINLISGYTLYPVKFAWYETQSRPASVNSGANWDDATINSHFESIAENSQKVIDQTVCEFLIPVGTAIQNARTITTIKALGAYADNPLNTSHLGYLTPYDGVHLQEGLPCQIAAYTFILSLLKIYGFDELSINGESTRVTTEWASGKSIPGPHGNYIGSTDANCLIAQQSAIMAMKKPFEVTDMNYIVNPT